MQLPFTAEWLKAYRSAFSLYVKGAWTEAKVEFENFLRIRPDKPS